jgi:thiamine biosynthesis lipoprotein
MKLVRHQAETFDNSSATGRVPGRSIYLREAMGFVVLAAMAGCCRTCPAPASEPRPLHRYQFVLLRMGVRVTLTVHATDEPTARKASAAAFDRIAQIESIASDWQVNSELSNLSRRAGAGPVRISEELFFLLARSQALAEQTDGAFDVTVGPVVQVWRKARQDRRLPADDELRRAMELIGWRKLRLDARQRTADLALPGMKLDLGGIAKGYACDEALKVLRQHGISSAMCEAGGDIAVGDAPPGSDAWTIGIPHQGADGRHLILELKNCAVSTSGDDFQALQMGLRYSHIIDPRTGIGLTTRILVTVVAPDGTTADSLSTAISVLGDKYRSLLAAHYPNASVHVKYVR